ncbi:hypothetical protein N9895_01385 [Gammaproteobacteria bacterium]|nr:hypothetical protein [bacterium]MDB4277673.1 hypothetical protein [Gammaproteobacteria bacterium]|tara:strand:- start:121 stop:675 length:555 start_codon:yes stop_codon:yes gene_type:complete
MRLTENNKVSDNLDYHLKNQIFLTENVFRPNSKKFFDLIFEVRELYNKNLIRLNEKELEIIESDFGKIVKLTTGEEIYLEVPMINEQGFSLSEAEYKGKDVSLNKPKTGGPKKWYVYVKNPSTGKIKKVSYGSPDMSANWNDTGARKSFAARHRCDKKKDKTKAGYWACRAHKDFGKNVPGRFW